MSKRKLFFVFLTAVWLFIIAGVIRAFGNSTQGSILVLMGLAMIPIYRELKKHV